MTKDLVDWTFDDLVAWSKGTLLIGIGNGDYNYAVFEVVAKTLEWQRDALVNHPHRKKKAGGK